MDDEFLADSNGEFRSLQNRVCAYNVNFSLFVRIRVLTIRYNSKSVLCKM